MSDIIKFKQVEDKIITIRSQNVILDSDVAELYGITTREVNQAVKNNPEKFPEGYIVTINQKEKDEVIKNFDHPKIKFSKELPKAFTEKGLYMLATILKSPVAVQTTIAIVETFTKVRNLSQKINELTTISDKESQKKLMQSSGELITELLDPEMETNGTETSIELNFAVLKFKHTIKKGTKK
ncbi:MAG: ORF6N domain-containing protein [Planctomycetaceae bacterium]|nr:ORF6N domain-containing protein [Planctomycetaceae bacterium]